MSKILEPTLQSLSSHEIKNSKNLYGIDIVKFIMAIFVVGIHNPPFIDYSMTLHCMFAICPFKMAVPFFFMSSSWLFFRKIDTDNIKWSQIWKYIKRLLIIYIFWTAFYLGEIIKMDLATDGTITVAGFFAKHWKEFLFSGSYFQLWYLIESAWCMLFIFALLKLKLKPKTIFVLAMMCYAIKISCFYLQNLWVGEFAVIVKSVAKCFEKVERPLLFAFPMMAAGLFLSKSNYTCNRKTAIMFFVILLVIDFGERAFSNTINITLPRSGDVAVFDIFLQMSLLYVAANVKLKKRKIYADMRKSSILIYLLHPIMSVLFFALFKEDNSLLRFTFVTITSIITSYIIIYFENFKYLKWLKYIH